MPTQRASPNYHPLVRGLAQALRQRCGVKEGDTVVVACSGGADSVALLRALHLLADRRRWQLRLIVAHVQHHLRGEAAEHDAGFVSSLAGRLGLGYERRDIAPGNQRGNTEANARNARYHALGEIALKRHARFVATAHHADDQLETLLMRMLRGAGLDGLRGIAWHRRLCSAEAQGHVDLIRPMLEADRAQVLSLLELLDQRWCEDATNRDTTRTRARLRHEVIPLLKQIQADAAGKATTLTRQFDHLHQLVQERVEAVSPAADGSANRQAGKAGGNKSASKHLDDLSRDRARSLNPMVLTQMLRTDLINAGVARDSLPGHALHPVIEAVRDHEGGTRRFDFASGITIQVGPEMVSVLQGGGA